MADWTPRRLLRESVLKAFLLLSSLGLLACGTGEDLMSRSVFSEPFGVAPDGQPVQLFNLKDAGATDILGHELTIAADGFTPVAEYRSRTVFRFNRDTGEE
jgi:hypothetical protein